MAAMADENRSQETKLAEQLRKAKETLALFKDVDKNHNGHISGVELALQALGARGKDSLSDDQIARNLQIALRPSLKPEDVAKLSGQSLVEAYKSENEKTAAVEALNTVLDRTDPTSGATYRLENTLQTEINRAKAQPTSDEIAIKKLETTLVRIISADQADFGRRRDMAKDLQQTIPQEAKELRGSLEQAQYGSLVQGLRGALYDDPNITADMRLEALRRTLTKDYGAMNPLVSELVAGFTKEIEQNDTYKRELEQRAELKAVQATLASYDVELKNDGYLCDIGQALNIKQGKPAQSPDGACR